jgi:alanyl-tRNA synthetase
LVPKVAELMSVPYPELSETTTRVAKVIETEEEHFIGTVDSGLEKIEKIFATLQTAEKSAVPGAEIFDMYQTFGFPPELFETLASERGFSFDWTGFKREMEHHGEISGSAERNLLFKNDPLESVKKQYGKTEFLGYGGGQCESKIIAILDGNGNLVDSVPEGQTVKIILDKTLLYGEKGGQVGDKGWITKRDHENYDQAFSVEDTQMDGDLTVHIGHQESGLPRQMTLNVGDEVLSVVGFARRAVARAHTATHLLHWALRATLGTHAEQQGSKVDEDVLRFDFTNHQAVDKETLLKIERLVNQLILYSNDVECYEMTIEEARKTGAMMLFGEKYPEKVRVVMMGGESGSKELCGGTHVKNPSEIGSFKIISESSVAAGIRRIEAYTGQKAVEKVLADSAIVQQVAATLKIPADDIPAKVEALAEQVKKLQKQIKTADGRRQTVADVDGLIQSAEIVSGVKLIATQLTDMDVNAVRQLLDQIREKTESVAILFAVVQEGKVALLAGASRDLTDRYSAVELLRRVAPLVGGKGGGGRPDFAQTGGKDPSKLPEAFAEAKRYFE